MGNQKIRVLIGTALVIGVGILFSFRDIPANPVLAEVGEMLGENTSFWLKSGQEGEKIVSELFGGYYFVESNTNQEDSLVWEENHRVQESAVNVSENEEPLVGDIAPAKGESVQTQGMTVLRKKNVLVEQLKESKDVKFLWKNFYIVDSTTSVSKDMFNVNSLLSMPMKMEKKKNKKQICIYHTHGASETFADSRKNVVEDTVVGIGDELTKELEKRGYGVYHDRTQYDLVNGTLDRSLAYNKSLDGMQAIRKEYPDIEVMIDLHRDSVGKGKHTYTTLQGKKTAIVMFFNGMSRNRKGAISYLYNPNLQGNLAFSLQLKCKAMEYYDGLTKPIYLKGYRYNLHLEKKSLLLEWGNENNSMEEAKNAAAPMADVLDKVLSGQG